MAYARALVVPTSTQIFFARVMPVYMRLRWSMTKCFKEMRERLYQPDYVDLTVVDFSDLAQSCKTYDEFIEKMGCTPESDLRYFGVAIFGAKKKVNKLTGSLPLLR